LVEGGRITAVGSRATIRLPAGAAVIDVSGFTVLPAFWNSHVHFIEPKWTGIARMDAARVDSLLSEMFTRFGFVHVFDLSSFPEVTLPLRGRIRDGQVHGPDILTTLMGFVPPAGTPRYVPFSMPELADARHARDSVRARMAVGADGIKLFTVPITRREPFPEMALGVVRAAVDEARAGGKRVFVHPTNAAGVALAVTGGADILAHTVPSAGDLPDSLLRDMQRRSVALIPTLTLWEDDYGPDTTGMRAFVRAAELQVQAFRAHGGRILFGTDVGYISRYDPTREYELMAHAGLDFSAILSSLTTAPAEEFGFGARRGQLAAGFDADIVVIDGDPVRDIRSLARVRLTFKRGQVLYPTPRTRAP
jgi:imidazolonepropionase-like amidohydrolase